MPERSEKVLKAACVVLAILALYQCSRFVARSNPLAHLKVPVLPSLSAGSGTQSGGEGTNSVPRNEPGKKPADIPPAISARIDRITQSEILGPVIRPLPMALLGIGGQDAFLRAPNGQTGLLKEGDELAGVKLLRIGTNRVLIEHEGQKKELTVFSGFGGETFLPQQNENSK